VDVGKWGCCRSPSAQSQCQTRIEAANPREDNPADPRSLFAAGGSRLSDSALITSSTAFATSVRTQVVAVHFILPPSMHLPNALLSLLAQGQNEEFVPSYTVRGLEARTESRRLHCERMYNMNSLIEESGRQVVNLIVCCPFCASPAHVVWEGLKPPLYGIRCRNCGASVPTIRATAKEAISVWNRRAGLASVGGKATAGIRSRRKLAAARRNLKKAREVRQLNRIRLSLETAYAHIRPYREQEFAESQAALAKSWAELAVLEPRIRRYPDLSELLDWLKSRWNRSDSHQCPPCDSVLYTKHNELDRH
jgi:restriction alleviation protein Lar